MTMVTPSANCALRGLKCTLPMCSRTGRVQPCLPLALAHAFNVPLSPISSRVLIRQAHQSRDVLNQHHLTRGHEDKISKRINPPTSTLPAPLDYPERQPDQSFAGYWWKVGKALWAFYKQGSKNIYANRNSAKELRARLAGASKEKMLDRVHRSEVQLLRRSRSEMRRVPIFAVILAAFGEWTPLLVMFATPIVPYNCRIPRQIKKAREKLEARRKASFRGDCRSLEGPSSGKSYVPSPRDVASTQSTGGTDLALSRNATLHICRSLNLYPAWMDKLLSAHPVGPIVLSASMRLSPRLSKHIRGYLNDDDIRLLKDCVEIKATDIPSRLNDEEVLLAAEDRGIDVLGRPLRDVRRDLGLWLEVSRRRFDTRSEKTDVKPLLRMLLSRPNQWDSIKRELPEPASRDISAPHRSVPLSAVA